MRGHIDPETLAAFREGLLPRHKAARVTVHLAECPQCAGLDAQLAGLPALLAHAPAPPMPDALTARIEAAIAAEAATRSAQAPAGVPGTEARVPGTEAGVPGTEAGGTRTSPAGSRGGGRGGRRQRPAPGRSRLALRITFAAAAVVVIAGGGYGVSRLVAGTPGGSGATSPASGSSAPGAAAAPAQNGIAGNQSQGEGHNRSRSPGSAAHLALPAGYPLVTSGTNYRASQLKAQIRAALVRFPEAVPAPQSGTVSPAPRSGIVSCLAGVTNGQRPRLVDVAHYEGKPATVVVMPAGAHALRALVFSQHCPVTGADLLNSVTLPRPG